MAGTGGKVRRVGIQEAAAEQVVMCLVRVGRCRCVQKANREAGACSDGQRESQIATQPGEAPIENQGLDAVGEGLGGRHQQPLRGVFKLLSCSVQNGTRKCLPSRSLGKNNQL